MTTFDLAQTPSPSPFSKWMPPIGGLMAAAIVAAINSPLPLVHRLSMSQLTASAVECVVAVFAASAVGVWILCMMRPDITRVAAQRLILRTSLDAVWLAPLALFVQESSIWAMAIAAVLVSGVARSFHLLRGPKDMEGSDESAAFTAGDFVLPESTPWFWRQARSAGAALCAQTGALVGFAGYPFTGSMLVGISSAVWTWSFTSDNQNTQFPVPAKSTSRILLALAIAIAVMAGGLLRYLATTYRIGGYGVASLLHLPHSPAHGNKRERPADKPSRKGEPVSPDDEKASEKGEHPVQAQEKETPDSSSTGTRDANSGIILWAKKQTYTKLVAPAPAISNGLQKNGRHANPLIIPFDGVYWFFKLPDRQPPSTSREAHGSPELLDIHSTDRRPLSMEAHEHLGSLLDLDCCSRIQIEIRNADTYQDTVSLELILIDSSAPGRPAQSLGTVMVKSRRIWKPYEEASPIKETLNFPLPPDPSIHRFDEVMVVFRLQAFRADDGARVAIDHFVLVPRGL